MSCKTLPTPDCQTKPCRRSLISCSASTIAFLYWCNSLRYLVGSGCFFFLIMWLCFTHVILKGQTPLRTVNGPGAPEGYQNSMNELGSFARGYAWHYTFVATGNLSPINIDLHASFPLCLRFIDTSRRSLLNEYVSVNDTIFVCRGTDSWLFTRKLYATLRDAIVVNCESQCSLISAGGEHGGVSSLICEKFILLERPIWVPVT